MNAIPASAMPALHAPRHVLRLSTGVPTSDGAGVKLTRLIGTPQQPPADPFLMLDAFGTERPQDYIAGFPPHPHRGFETVTYMLKGRMRHRDNKGGEGLLVPGSVQWMTAGRGIVHSEMPEQVEGEMRGFQLWVNLPARDKMQAPRYQEFAPERIAAHAIKVTRDAEIDVDDDLTRSLMEKMASGLAKRKRGDYVRFLYDARMPKEMLGFIKRKLKLVDTGNIIAGSRYHNRKDLMGFPDFGRKELVFAARPPLPHPQLQGATNLFDEVRKGDVLLQRTECAIAEGEDEPEAFVLEQVARGGRVGTREGAGAADHVETHGASLRRR